MKNREGRSKLKVLADARTHSIEKTSKGKRRLGGKIKILVILPAIDLRGTGGRRFLRILHPEFGT